MASSGYLRKYFLKPVVHTFDFSVTSYGIFIQEGLMGLDYGKENYLWWGIERGGEQTQGKSGFSQSVKKKPGHKCKHTCTNRQAHSQYEYQRKH